MKYESSGAEYQPYRPGSVDEEGNDIYHVVREKKPGRSVRLELQRKSRAKGKLVLAESHGLRKHQVYAIRRHFDPEFRRRQQIKERLAVGAVALAVGGIVVGGCIAAFKESNNPPSEDLKPNQRYIFDYLTVGKGGSECFDDTAYDLNAGSKGRSSVTPPSASYNDKTGILTITPPGGENSLRLEGFDQTQHTLSPVGELDEAIFESYGCEVENY